jgi:error-prone DNA polymerase
VPPDYIELRARSAFSFLHGASPPEAMAARAGALGLKAAALCDTMGVYGSARFRGAARECGVRPIVGAELRMSDGAILPVLVESRTGYHNLCRMLTRAHLRAAKGEGAVTWQELPEFAAGLKALTGGVEGPLGRTLLAGGDGPAALKALTGIFGCDKVAVDIGRSRRAGEDRLNRRMAAAAQSAGLPLVAVTGAVFDAEERRAVADVFTCLRHHTHLDAAGSLLEINGERRLRSAAEMAELFPDLPEAVSNTVRFAESLTFELADLGYEFPRHPVGRGETMDGVLRDWALRGAKVRYPAGAPPKVAALLEKELAIIAKLGFAGYFLIVADLVRYCRENGILAQGRGSAANSAVCFCLGVTAVDPVKFNVLFERFLSEGRKGWPDIDIDLPSGDRREQVIQEVYRRYGPHGAAMTGAVHTYRGRGAARELGKALNLPADVLDRFSNLFGGGDFADTLDLASHLERAGLPPSHPRSAAFQRVYPLMARLPRHLGQHSGGMIICEGSLHRFVPLENAAMPGRVVAQWDKDDCEDMGIIKVDLLGLGMMAALQDAVTMSNARGRPIDLAQLPECDEATFDMLRKAETIGVFQVESRAQMATLPRMQPRTFYDLVVEVAIIRPGPIQGNLTHPYLARRSGDAPVTYYDERLVPVLARTLGVPLFQEQMLEIAMVMADFSGSEAEDLRKALSFHRSEEKMRKVESKLRAALERKGVADVVREEIVKAIGSFALYGFPESHAISFALLAYASAYLKVHRAPEFFAALLNNQPMGFYSPATLLADARRRGLKVRPVCAVRSSWACTIEGEGSLRLGFQQVSGVRRETAESLVAERARKPFASLDDLMARTRLNQVERRALASIGAFNVFAGHRRAAMWAAERPQRPGELLPVTPADASPLRPMEPAERVAADYAGMQLSTGPHPMALMRSNLPDMWRAADLVQARDGETVRVAGQVICRQRPGTAKGVCFVSLEDETGISNAIVSPELFEEQRLTITSEPFLIIEGVVQNRRKTIHIKARRITRLEEAGIRTAASHDFA